MMKIYLAQIGFNPQITEFEVEEKGKTYKVISRREIMGWEIWAKLIKKDDPRICKSVYDAILYLEKESKSEADDRESDFKEAFDRHKILREISDAIRADPSRIDKALAELKK